MVDFDNKSPRNELSFKRFIKQIPILIYNRENVIEKGNIEDLICPICFDILKNPISCSNNKNSHSFCKECITQHLKENNKCPTCKLNFEYKINFKLNNILNKLSFECLFKKEGCKDILSYSEYLNHLNNCKYNNNIEYECNIKTYNYNKKEFQICGYIGDKTEIEKHFKICGLTQFKCSFCNINMLQMDIEAHFTNKCKIKYEQYPNGDKYIGEQINNIKEGYGIKYYPNGDKYEGQFKNNKKEGFGIYKYSDGDNYIGEFKNDLREGYGIYYFYNCGVTYEGEFKNGKRDGYGIEYYPDKIIYKGEFKDDKIDGYGFFLYSDGSKYIGGFKNNMREGFGIDYNYDGDRYIGIYKNDMKNGYGIEYFPNGNKYKGNFKNDIFDGYGILYLSDGAIYEGDFKNGMEEGFGIVYFQNGDRYEGEFLNGIYNGYAIFYSHLGLQVKRYFKNDFSTKILYIVYKIILILNYLYSKLIKNRVALLLVIILIIELVICN